MEQFGAEAGGNSGLIKNRSLHINFLASVHRQTPGFTVEAGLKDTFYKAVCCSRTTSNGESSTGLESSSNLSLLSLLKNYVLF